MQFVPDDGVYVYFRYDTRQTVMCIMNQNDKEMEINSARFAERLKGFSRAKNIVDGKTNVIGEKIKVPAKTVLVLELLP